MGREKLVLPLGDAPVVRHVFRAVQGVRLLGAGIDEVVLVVNPKNRDAVVQALGSPVTIVVNERYAEGLGTSIAAAAAAVPDATELLLLQGDQPLVTSAMLEDLIEARRSAGALFAACRFDGIVTTPVVFERALFEELARLGGDRGARSVLDRHRAGGRLIDLPAWQGVDVDSPEDYRVVQESWRARHSTTEK